MKIDRNNYEAYLLDLIEGNLSPEQESDLMMFLSENPDLEATIEIPDIKLQSAEAEYPSKDELKKGGEAININRGNFEQFVIARLEGDLSFEASMKLDRYLIDNPQLKKSAGIIDLLRLKPDRSILCPQKELLRRSSPVLRLHPVFLKRKTLYRIFSIAASIALIVSVSFFIMNERGVDSNIYVLGEPEVQFPVEKEIIQLPSASGTEYFAADDRPDPVAENIISAHSEERDQSTEIPGREIPVEKVETFVEERAYPPAPVSPIHGKIELENTYSVSSLYPVRLTGINRTPGRMDQYQSTTPNSGRILNGVMNFLARVLDEEKEVPGISLLDIANAGFRGINNVAGTDLRIEREYNAEGEVVSMAFNSRLIEIQHKSSDFGE